MRVLAAAACLCFVACRFGGPGGDALLPVEPEADAAVDAAVDAAAAAVDAGPHSLPFDSGSVDASASTDANMLPPDDAGPTDGSQDAGDASDSGACLPSVLPGCDPVHNQGCSDGFTQCVLDPSASEPTGHCVVSGFEMTPCAESVYSTSCTPQHTCVAEQCRKFCSCDSDCDDGETCSEALAGVETGEVRLCVSPNP